MAKKARQNTLQYVPRPGLAQKFVCAEFGTVDLQQITPAQARELCKAGYLIEKNEETFS